jgi:maltose alpha-D-glucosyltransferase/alpha-amylase
VVADLEHRDGERGILHDAVLSAEFRDSLMDLVRTRHRLQGLRGELVGVPYPRLHDALAGLDVHDSRVLSVEQSNTSMVFGGRLIMKLYRRLESGTSLDLELGLFLSEAGFTHTPAVVGAIEYESPGNEARTVAIVQEFVPNEGDAWGLALDAVSSFLERAELTGESAPDVDTNTAALLNRAGTDPSEQARDLMGVFIEELRLLGQRTGELHVALSSDTRSSAFAPEPFTLFYQRSLYQSMRNQAGRLMNEMGARIARLPHHLHDDARLLVTKEPELMERLRRVIVHKVGGKRIRIHGDYHLGQVIFTGKDFYITDFEGEPLRPLSERRLKRSPLRDVAGMLRSLHYAANSGVLQESVTKAAPADTGKRANWMRFWYAEAAATFLRGYFTVTATSGLFPPDARELEELLDAYLLEKAIYELEYEINNRPAWAEIPLRGLMDMLKVHS